MPTIPEAPPKGGCYQKSTPNRPYRGCVLENRSHSKSLSEPKPSHYGIAFGGNAGCSTRSPSFKNKEDEKWVGTRTELKSRRDLIQHFDSLDEGRPSQNPFLFRGRSDASWSLVDFALTTSSGYLASVEPTPSGKVRFPEVSWSSSLVPRP